MHRPPPLYSERPEEERAGLLLRDAGRSLHHQLSKSYQEQVHGPMRRKPAVPLRDVFLATTASLRAADKAAGAAAAEGHQPALNMPS